MTSSVEECALRARSTHGVHHAIVEVNIVIGVVLGEVLVARVVPLVVDAGIGLTLGLIDHVVIVVFVVAIFKRIFLYGEIYSLHWIHLVLSASLPCLSFLPASISSVSSHSALATGSKKTPLPLTANSSSPSHVLIRVVLLFHCFGFRVK